MVVLNGRAHPLPFLRLRHARQRIFLCGPEALEREGCDGEWWSGGVVGYDTQKAVLVLSYVSSLRERR